ncbi:MAG: LysM peptidoglycan-binding domain-containing protein [Chloroflexi bacterium]|nr:LysM peptidoglycan-binding domain-containing protein [Chloroflexota bacterium]
MRAFREALGGLLLAAITTLTVVGGIFLAMSETGGRSVTPTLIAEASPQDTAEATVAASPVEPSPTPTPTLSPTFTSTVTETLPVEPTPTQTLSATATPCLPPRNWVAYTVQRGDTLFQLGLRYRLTTRELQEANCLSKTDLQAGQRLFVPTLPTSTPTPTPTETATLTPTETPIPEKLAITNVVLENVERDESRTNGAIAIIRVEFSGGLPPYAISDEGIIQAGSPMRIPAECDGTLIHTARVDSADGQIAVKSYYFSPITCP